MSCWQDWTRGRRRSSALTRRKSTWTSPGVVSLKGELFRTKTSCFTLTTNMSDTKTQLLDFLESWAAGTARAVTVGNYATLRQLEHCQDTLPDAFCEQLDLAVGSSYGEAAQWILELLA